MTPILRLILALAVAVLTPYLARLPGIPVHRADWFWSYLPGLFGVVFFAVFAALPGGALFALTLATGHARLGFWLGLIAIAAANFAFHSQVDLAADAQAAIALVIIPFPVAIAAIAAFFAGFGIDWLRRR